MSYIYKKGDIPIILLSLHGGGTKLNCGVRLPKEKTTHVIKNDTNTKAIAQQTYRHMYEHGLKPYLIINNIHRSHVDLNRYMDKGCNQQCDDCLAHYIIFHDRLQKTVLSIIEKFGKCLIFDIHGNVNSTNVIQFGYGIKYTDLLRGDFGDSSLYLINNSSKNMYDYIIGKHSFSHYFKSYFSNVYPINNNVYMEKTNSKYYSGRQYIITKYRQICDTVLVELSPELRRSTVIDSTSKKIAEGLTKYYENVYLKL